MQTGEPSSVLSRRSVRSWRQNQVHHVAFCKQGGASAACFTVTINAALGGAGDIESVAYLGSYDPTNLCLNYLGDTGIVGLGTMLGSATYSFTVPAGANFVMVVNTTGTITASSEFSGTVSGFVNDTPGSGPCPTR